MCADLFVSILDTDVASQQSDHLAHFVKVRYLPERAELM